MGKLQGSLRDEQHPTPVAETTPPERNRPVAEPRGRLQLKRKGKHRLAKKRSHKSR